MLQVRVALTATGADVRRLEATWVAINIVLSVITDHQSQDGLMIMIFGHCPETIVL
jgi:hypothetical protein